MKTTRVLFAALLLYAIPMVLVQCNAPAPKTDIDAKVRVAILVGEGFHDGEAYMPMGYLVNKGAKVTVIGPEVGVVKAYNSDFTIRIEKSIEEVSVDDFDALILPGGQAPAQLRENADVVEFTRKFFESGKVTAAICHGPQVLVRAGVLDGLKSTSFIGIQAEMEAAGVIFKDTSVVVDGNLITSRIPVDLSEFSKAIEKALF